MVKYDTKLDILNYSFIHFRLDAISLSFNNSYLFSHVLFVLKETSITIDDVSVVRVVRYRLHSIEYIMK